MWFVYEYRLVIVFVIEPINAVGPYTDRFLRNFKGS
jgi:hypothetical protein